MEYNCIKINLCYLSCQNIYTILTSIISNKQKARIKGETACIWDWTTNFLEFLFFN